MASQKLNILYARLSQEDERAGESNSIQNQLKKDKILTPGCYYHQKYGVLLKEVNIEEPYNWSTNSVVGILEDETYLGHTINLKSSTLSFKNKKKIPRSESEWLRFENTHEALVDQQTWEIVQDIRKHKRRPAKMAEQNIWIGLLHGLRRHNGIASVTYDGCGKEQFRVQCLQEKRQGCLHRSLHSGN